MTDKTQVQIGIWKSTDDKIKQAQAEFKKETGIHPSKCSTVDKLIKKGMKK